MADNANLEGSSPPDLFKLEIRLRWLICPLPRWRFRAPQGASLRRIGRQGGNGHTPTDPTAPPAPQLSAFQKFLLIRTANECCYWCERPFGSVWGVHGTRTMLRLHWDHVRPQSAGGLTEPANMVPACHLCNLWKSGRVFNNEAEIRTYLGDRWASAINADVAEETSQTAPIAGADIESIAPSVVRLLRGRKTTPRVPGLKFKVAEPSPEDSHREWPAGTEVVVVSRGAAHGQGGIVAGPSRDRADWVRVLLGPQMVPWRFAPHQLAAA